MIVGIGLDIVEVLRIESAIEKWGDKFERKLFTETELKSCCHKAMRLQQLAGRFAAKEALFKALGTGLRQGMLWNDVEVKNDPLGKPLIRLTGETKKFSDLLGISEILVSLSHTSNYAAAQVILIGKKR